MKLIRFGQPGLTRPGIIDKKGIRRDVSEFGEDFTELFFEKEGLDRLRRWLDKHKDTLPEVPEKTRLCSPICRPSKLVCIGLNYVDHARESGLEPPSEPVIFFKATSAITGPNDPLYIPQGGTKTDWEVELAIVIGKTTKNISEEKAIEHIAGYLLHNDYSERAFQLERGGQWVKGKSADSFAPLGPFLATIDEIEDVHNLRLWLKVNGSLKQDGNTSNLIFKVPFIVSYVSKFMTLLPGDIISTGTPAGVGMGGNPPVYLKDGDVVELGIDGLGSSSQHVIGEL